MGLSEGDLAKTAREPGSIETCMKALFSTAEELEHEFESLHKRLEPILREHNSEIEEDRKRNLVPAGELTVPVTGKCGLAVELVTVVQKIRMMKVQTDLILRNLDL